MSVALIVTTTQHFTIHGAGDESMGTGKTAGDPVDTAAHPALIEVACAAILGADAKLKNRDGVWSVEDDPMKGALLAAAGWIGLRVGETRGQWPRAHVIPFDAKHRFMAKLNHDHEHHAVAFVKGAPEQVLAMCRDQRLPDGNVSPIDPDYWQEQAERIAAQGQRVIAVAAKSLPSGQTVLEFANLERDLTVLALMAGMALPITPVQILWVNMITAVSLGIALAFESTEANTMRRPPRPRDRSKGFGKGRPEWVQMWPQPGLFG